MKVNIEGLNKVKLVKALYDNAQPTEKTDTSKDITLDDIAYFVNKDRKINVINGKSIKTDIGRDKLSSGVYDKFNGGEYGTGVAEKAINELKSKYSEYIIEDGKTLDDCINELSETDKLVVANFNGHPIYSDNIDEDEIYTRVTGKSKSECNPNNKKLIAGYIKEK